MSHYKNLFFDLDDTLWAFSENTWETFEEMYHQFNYERFFSSFKHFYRLYEWRNLQLWNEYGLGEITKEELNRQRFLYPLEAVKVANAAELAAAFAERFFATIPTKSGVMPHAHEVLEYLSPRYNLYILSNGFQELQRRKMQSADIDRYFKQVILSDDIGVLKPRLEIFHFALSATQSQPEESLMIGDNWENDIAGARGAGIDQVFYDVYADRDYYPFAPTYHIADLMELTEFL
ncbi:MAG: YjjG family noncanonical pyrimidine nucleotidase [Prevotellaceae bacterium]|nr:YjjG family noncanonical pyrimidine nucleotidase [Prevotellaceae bacterium]